MGRIVRILAFASLVGITPAALAGQEGGEVEDRGSQGILVGVGDRATVGLWFRLGDRTDVGLEGFFSIADDDTDNAGGSTRVFGVRPAVKGYVGDSDASVAPYWIAGLSFEHSKVELGGAGDRTRRSIGGLVGVGLDWFPAERVSVGGHVGLEGAATRTTVPPVLPGSDDETSGYELGTLSSGIRLQIWF